MQKRVKPSDQLKDLLARRKNEPMEFARTTLGRPETLRRVLAFADEHVDYERVIGSNRTPAAQALSVFRCLLVVELVQAIRVGDSARSLAQGLYLLWHQCLDPIVDYSHKLPSLADVIAYCSEKENYHAFIRQSKVVLNSVHESNETKRKELTVLIDADTTFTLLTSGLGRLRNREEVEHRRRKLADHVSQALATLAQIVQQQAPEVFDGLAPDQVTSITPNRTETWLTGIAPSNPVAHSHHAAARVSLDDLCARGLRLLGQLMRIEGQEMPSACELRFPISAYLERSVTSQNEHAEMVIPSSEAWAPDALSKMSGVLIGVPGSGRTSFLKHMAFQWSAIIERDVDTPIVCYFTASDYLTYAKSRTSVSRFIGDQVLAFSQDREAAQALRKELETRNPDGNLLFLVDDLDRLSQPEQEIVLDQLALAPAVLIATVPWEAERVLRQMRSPYLSQFKLKDLDERAQGQMLERFFVNLEHGIRSGSPGNDHRGNKRPFLYEAQQRQPHENMDAVLKSRFARAHLMLKKTPDLAALPLGITAICAQAVREAINPATIAQRVLDELFERASLPPSRLQIRWPPDSPTLAAVLHAAAVVGHALNILLGHRAGNPKPDLLITRYEFEALAPEEWEGRWEMLAPTRLFEHVTCGEGEAIRFYNRDLMCYLIATAIQAGHLELDRSQKEQMLSPTLFRSIRSYQTATPFSDNLSKDNRESLATNLQS